MLACDPLPAVFAGLLAGTAAGIVNGLPIVGLVLSAEIATLGLYHAARGVAASGYTSLALFY